MLAYKRLDLAMWLKVLVYVPIQKTRLFYRSQTHLFVDNAHAYLHRRQHQQ